MRKGEKKGKKMKERERERKTGFDCDDIDERGEREKKHTEAKATRGFDQALILYLYQRYFFYIALSLNIS